MALVGDGGFTMMMGEVATLVKYKLPVKVIIFKNNTLGQIKWEQMVFEGNPEFGVDLQPIDFAAYAKACGAGGFTVDDPGNVDSVLREAFAHPGPAARPGGYGPQRTGAARHITVKQALHFAECGARREVSHPDYQRRSQTEYPRSGVMFPGCLAAPKGARENALPSGAG